jgi:transposase
LGNFFAENSKKDYDKSSTYAIIRPMISTISNLPGTVAELQNIIIEREQQYQTHIKILEEKIRFLQDKIFGRKSEKLPAKGDKYCQLALFNEAEAIVESASASQEQEALDKAGTDTDTISVPAHTRQKPGRKPIPDHLPRVEVIHDLSEEEKLCGCGCQMSKIGEEVSEKLDIIPAKIQVIRHIRYKYACKNCEGVESEESAVKVAPTPPQLIPKSMATEGLVAYIIVSKFADALPFYRQEGIFERIGVEIPRSTMANWAIQTADACEPILSLMHQELLSGPIINMDETPVQVLGEEGRLNTTKSYMWAFRGGGLDEPVLIFQYDPTRSGHVPKDYLQGYSGYIQTDGYKGYDDLGKQPGIIHLGCWSHARRMFVDVLDALPAQDRKKKAGNATNTALGYIGTFYAIEAKAREGKLTIEEIYQLRQKKSKPILEQFKAWLTQLYPQTPPKGLLGKAIEYCLNQWPKLERYIIDGRLKIDNNLIENAIRPFVLGRKNWLFSGNPRGAKASAALYSLIETAKANGLEPYHYLRFLFEKLPLAKTQNDYKALLPQHLNREQLKNLW